jgi:VIT1/CCC1 family predicted Fe2+/Mn2+ transporter
MRDHVRIHTVATIKSRVVYYIGDIVYGANDGIITTFAVIAGASGAGFSSAIIIVLGIANLIADGFSMGASKYLSLQSEQSIDKDGTEGRSPVKDGTATFVAFVVAGALPLIPFLIPGAEFHTFTISSIATAVAFPRWSSAHLCHQKEFFHLRSRNAHCRRRRGSDCVWTGFVG